MKVVAFNSCLLLLGSCCCLLQNGMVVESPKWGVYSLATKVKWMMCDDALLYCKAVDPYVPQLVSQMVEALIIILYVVSMPIINNE